MDAFFLGPIISEGFQYDQGIGIQVKSWLLLSTTVSCKLFFPSCISLVFFCVYEQTWEVYYIPPFILNSPPGTMLRRG